MGGTGDASTGYDVLVFDMAHTGDDDAERLIRGFPTLDAAEAYAQARVRASVEELREPDMPPDDLKRLWYMYGEDCSVIGGSYRGSEQLMSYIYQPATPSQTDWTALEPRLRRYYASLLFMDAEQQSTWIMRFFEHLLRPSKAELLERFAPEARAKLADQGHTVTEPLDVSVASLFALPDPPVAPPDRSRPLAAWRVTVDFVCHDIKFGATAARVFAWRGEPSGAALETMVRVVVAETLAIRGSGPDWLDVTDIISVKVEPTGDEPDYPAEDAA